MNPKSIQFEKVDGMDSIIRLVKLTGRAFYDDICTENKNPTKSGRKDDRAVAVVVLDALTRRGWVREVDLAMHLKLHTKQLRRVLRLFEEDRFITREHRKENSRGTNNAAVASVGDGQSAREWPEKLKTHTQSYCCLDYSQIYDVVRYRLHRMKKMLKEEIESKNKVQEYVCPSCSKRYNALDALGLISPYDGDFHCERCDGILVAESDTLAARELGDGDAKARRCRQEKFKDLLRKMEDHLEPLIKQIGLVKDLTFPEFETLRAWEVRARASGRDNGIPQGLGATPMGNTQIEVTFSDEDNKGDVEITNNKNVNHCHHG